MHLHFQMNRKFEVGMRSDYTGYPDSMQGLTAAITSSQLQELSVKGHERYAMMYQVLQLAA